MVAVSRDHTVGYSSQQAAEDYRKRGDILRVRVLLLLTPTYPLEIAPKLEITVHEIPGATARSEDFWKDFGYELRQDDLPVKPLSIRGEAAYSGDSRNYSMTGAQVWLEYAAENVLRR